MGLQETRSILQQSAEDDQFISAPPEFENAITQRSNSEIIQRAVAKLAAIQCWAARFDSNAADESPYATLANEVAQGNAMQVIIALRIEAERLDEFYKRPLVGINADSPHSRPNQIRRLADRWEKRISH